MVYYKTGKGKGRKKYGVTIGAGPVKITSAKPSLTNQVKNVQKSVRDIQSKEELKYKDTFLNGTSISTTETLTLLNGLSLGDDVSNRDGDSISATSIQFRVKVTQAPTQIAAEGIIRHIIFWDSQANGAAPSAGDLLDKATITSSILAPYKRQYQKRFKILYDKVYRTVPMLADPAAATTEILQPKIYKKAKVSLSRVVKYRNAQNSGTITDIASNSLYSLYVTDLGAGTMTVDCGYRMYYKDD